MCHAQPWTVVVDHAGRDVEPSSGRRGLVHVCPAARARVGAPIRAAACVPHGVAHATFARRVRIVRSHGRIILDNARWVAWQAQIIVGEGRQRARCRHLPGDS
eukprot:1526353-Prymnesium_polylepis.2